MNMTTDPYFADVVNSPLHYTIFGDYPNGPAPTTLEVDSTPAGTVVHYNAGAEAQAIPAPFVINNGVMNCPQTPTRGKLASYRHWKPAGGQQVSRVGVRFMFRKTGTAPNSGMIGTHIANNIVNLSNSQLKMPVHAGITQTSWKIEWATLSPGWFQGVFNNLANGAITPALPYDIPLSIEVFRFGNAVALRLPDGSVKWAYDSNGNVGSIASVYGVVECYRDNATQDDVDIIADWYGYGLNGSQ